jgi:hypothetical protein
VKRAARATIMMILEGTEIEYKGAIIKRENALLAGSVSRLLLLQSNLTQHRSRALPSRNSVHLLASGGGEEFSKNDIAIGIDAPSC